MTPPVTIRFFFSGLPTHELGVYRALRSMGLDRRDANLIMYGRFTLHRIGTVRTSLVES